MCDKALTILAMDKVKPLINLSEPRGAHTWDQTGASIVQAKRLYYFRHRSPRGLL